MNHKFNNHDFVITNQSKKPAPIISQKKYENNYDYLISIDEYGGDYIWTSDIKRANILTEEKLSILANFEDFFYNEHKLLYQEIILETIIKFKK
jgi:hypothetical protein